MINAGKGTVMVFISREETPWRDIANGEELKVVNKCNI